MIVRPLVEADLDEADRIFRTAFGTFVGLPDPLQFGGDGDHVRTRWRADPSATVGAELDGRLVGSNFATSWGSVGFFGPLSVSPDRWDAGIGQRLLDATMEIFAGWGTSHIGLYTFAQSAKHVGLYQRYGFWPRFLTAIMSRPVSGAAKEAGRRLSELSDAEQAAARDAVRDLTDAVYPGLDVTREIDAVASQALGETVLLDDDRGMAGVAVCHVGPGTEAGGGNCYVKFGAVRPGPSAAATFDRLVGACVQLAADRGATTIVAGANAGRERAWRALGDLGFRRDMQGVAMQRPNEPGYNTSEAFVIDDWR